MAKVDYAASAAQIVELVGGKDNISKVTHCITRVRFTLKDNAFAHENVDAVSSVPGVIQVIEQGGQYQVVIGTTVEQMYDEVVAITGNAGGEVDVDDTPASDERLNPFQMLIKVISGIMVPCLGALTGCGIIASLSTLLLVLGIAPDGSDTHVFLYNIGQTCMFFFPVIIGFSAAKYFGMEQFLGAVIGGALMYPVVNNAELAGVTARVFGIIPVTYQAYASTVFPAMAAVAFASVVYKFLKKSIPAMVSFFLVPTLTLLVTLPVAFAVIAPVMNLLSSLLTTAIMAIYSFSPVIAGLVINALWLPIIVPMGIHQALAIAFFTELFTTGQSPALGLLCGILSVSGVLMAVWAKSKDPDTKQLALSTAITNAMGISEPGLYGVIMQHAETLLALSIGAGITGIIPALFHTTVYSMGASGLFGLPMYMNPDGTMTSFLGAVVTNIAAFVICFAIAYFWPGFDPDKK